MTLEKLAAMVVRGFDKAVTKEYLDGRINELDIKLSNRIDKLDFDISELRDILDRFEENDVFDLQKRVKTLERIVRVMAKKLVQ